MKQTILKTSLFFLLFFIPLSTSAQMFSVDDDDEKRTDPFAPYIRAGIKVIDFEYQGNPSQDLLLSFTGTAAHVAFESGGFNLGVSLANDLTGLEDHKYFDLNLNFVNPFYLIRRPYFGAGIPVKLATKVTSVRSDLVSEEFSQSNLSAGAGGIVRFFFPKKLDATAQFIPSFGFSTASGGFIGGNVFSMRGKVRVNFYNLIFERNISIGYDYIFDSYNIDGEEFDYDLTGHAITLGVSL